MNESRAFGVLKLAGMEFAVDAHALEQVIDWPSRLQPHPSQRGALVGMFCLRGHALPLIDLRSLLGECDVPAGQPTEMVAIVNHLGRRLGIAVNGVSDVMKIESRTLCHLSGQSSTFALLPELALVDNERMVYLLDLQALSGLPEVLTARAGDAGQVAQVLEASQVSHHLLVFECEQKRYAVDAKAITELVDKPTMAPSKFGVDYCLGVTNRRGVDVPALSLSRVLGVENADAAGEQDQLLVLTSREGYRIGLVYDRMVAIIRARASDILPLSTYGLREPELFAGVIGVENGEQALLIEHRTLLERPQTLNFAKIYQPVAPGQDTSALRSVQSGQTCLVFRAPVQFVVPLDQVQEILDMPERYVIFGQRDSHLMGSFNLRGEQIPLVCLSSLIEGSTSAENARTRVLLVKGAFSSFGLVVNGTDSIETFTHPASEHPAGWESGMNNGASVNARVRSLVSIGRGEQNRWMTLINLRDVVMRLEKSCEQPTTSRLAS
ncbi:chemotaxis protein CheW [Pseudomonas huanghezhanensis]|uniref:chemotaxis protein CheW n=1 Tax=Pseudomonas huanghezhanensis TaxID=3002903 RepID=UPI002286AD5B|nr:chemotaxis protein CheW [Pseudomonas sp. BSw22131]